MRRSRRRGWAGLAWIAVGLGAALLAPERPVSAQTADAEDLRARVERLERENDELRQALARPFPFDVGLSHPLDRPSVEDVVDQRIQEFEAQKRTEEEQKKKEADQQGYVVGSDPKMTAAWNNGLVLESAHKDFRMKIGTRIQNDWVWFREPDYLKAPPAMGGLDVLRDGTFFRRLRLQAKGEAWEVTEFNLEFDLENITSFAMDHAWWGVKDVPVLGTVRVGQHKVPQGLESYEDSKWLTFLDRSSNFDAYLLEFAPGIFVSNNYLDQHVTWAAMFHRTGGLAPHLADGTTGSDFGTGEYAATARVTLLPVYEAEGRWLLHLGSSYQWRSSKFDNALGIDEVRYRARSEIRDGVGFGFNNNNNRWIDTGPIAAESASLFGEEIMANLGSLHLRTEYYLVVVPDASFLRGSTLVPIGTAVYPGWYIQAAWFLTGEHQPYDRRFGLPDRPKPLTNFFCVRTEEGMEKGWGLWEIAIRYSIVDFTHNPIPASAGGSVGSLNQWTVGLTWWLNSSMKVQWNYVRADRDVAAPARSGAVDELAMRFHIDF